jgi:hypothetical protein
MVAQLGVILYVAGLGRDRVDVIFPGLPKWGQAAVSAWLIVVILLLTLGAFCTLLAAVTNNNGGGGTLPPWQQAVVLAAVMSGIAALVVAPLWRHLQDLAPTGRVVIRVLPAAAALTGLASALFSSPSVAAPVFGVLLGLVGLSSGFLFGRGGRRQ